MAVAVAIAHHEPVDFVVKLNVTLPLPPVVPDPVATIAPVHEIEWTASETPAPLTAAPDASVTTAVSGTL